MSKVGPLARKLGGVAEGTSIEVTVWSAAGLALLCGPRDTVLAALESNRAILLAQLLRSPPPKDEELGGLSLRRWDVFVHMRDGQGVLVACVGPRGAMELARLLEAAAQDQAAGDDLEGL